VRRHGVLSEKEAMRIISELLEALQLVHSHGYVHRDIKPGNIMIRPDGSVCLLDFGIAKDMNRAGNGMTSFTGFGATIGTAGYMSPEQAEGNNIDHRSDIYSLGCVLFYMLTGQHAIKEESNEIKTRLSIINNPFPSAKLYNPNVSNNIQTVLSKATDKNMTKRFQSCHEFATELEKLTLFENGNIELKEQKLKTRKTPSSGKSKRPFLYLLGAAGGIVLIIVSCWLIFRESYPAEVVASEVVPEEIRTQYDMVQDSLYCGLVLVEKDHKYGYLDKTGKEIILLAYDEALPFSEGFAAVMIDDKWGFINRKGKTVIPLIYNEALSFQKGVAPVKKDWKWGLIDRKTIEIIPFIYQDAFQIKNGINAFKNKDKWALMDRTGKEITAFIYDLIWYNEPPYDEVIRVGIDEKYGTVDVNAKTVIPVIYDRLQAFIHGIARAEKNEKWGVIDLTGKIIIPFENELIYWSDDNTMLYVKKEEKKYGLYNKEGKELLPPEYEYIFDFSEGLAHVEKNGKYGFIDTAANVVIPLIYDGVGYFSEGLAWVGKEGKYGFINASGDLVIPAVYDNVKDFSDGLSCVVKYDEGYGFIDKKGKTVVPLHYYFGFSFSENLAPAVKQGGNGKVGFIDKSEHAVIPFEYDYVHLFSDNLAAVRKNGKWGYINRQGHEITPFIYQEAGDFDGTVTWIKRDGKYGCINNFGQEVTPPVYDESFYFSNNVFIPSMGESSVSIHMENSLGQFDPSLLSKKPGITGEYAIAKMNGKQGVLKNDGTIVIPFVYDSLVRYARGLLKATRGEQVVYVDKYGKEYSQYDIEGQKTR
jgi:hypothetical protein